jgi:hypothetical protein
MSTSSREMPTSPATNGRANNGGDEFQYPANAYSKTPKILAETIARTIGLLVIDEINAAPANGRRMLQGAKA